MGKYFSECQLDLEEGYKVYEKYFSAQRFLENIAYFNL